METLRVLSSLGRSPYGRANEWKDSKSCLLIETDKDTLSV